MSKDDKYLSEEDRTRIMLKEYSDLLCKPLTKEMVEYHMTGEAGWEEYEGPKPKWVNDLPREKDVNFNCSDELKILILKLINSRGIFRFGIIWTTEYPIESKYIDVELIPKSLQDDYFLFTDELVHYFGDNVLIGEIHKEHLSIKSEIFN